MSPAAVSKPSSPGVARTAIANAKYAYVNLRNGPGTDYDDIGDIRDKTLVVYYPTTERNGGWVWLEQRGLGGWAYTGVITFEDVVADPGANQSPTPYDGQIGIWHWKGQGVPENTVADMVNSFKRWAPNVKQIWVKTNDGENWQGKWDNSAMAINGPDSIDHWVDVLGRNGLEFHAWCVMRGTDIENEANTIIQVCQRPGVKSIILDVEPYTGYWSGGREGIRPLMTQVRRAVPGSFHIGLSVDPRPWHYDKIFPEEWFPFVNSVHPMVYWKTFAQTPEQSLEQTYQTWGGYGRPIIPILESDTEVVEQQQAVTLATNRYGATGISWWRYGMISQWQAINTPIVVDTSPADETESEPTDQIGDEQVIKPGGEGFRSGSYTGQQEFSNFQGTWGWNVYYKATESSGSKVWAEWKADLKASGLYQISVFIPTRHASTTRARYKIHGIKGTDTEVVVDLNQSRYRNQWVSLGIFELEKGAPNAGKVFLNDLTGESGAEIAFDAIRWRQIVTTTPTQPTEPVEPDKPIPPIIDGVYIADGYDSPVGSLADRRGLKVWPSGWLDASPFARLYFVGTPSEAYHTGADLNWGQPYEDKGLPVYSTASGVVVFAGRLAVWGNVIVIRHDPLKRVGGFVLYSRYGHVQNIKVEVGQRVKRGDQVAEIGDAFGRYVPHLHFDLSPTTKLERSPQDWPATDYNRLISDYVDPKVFIQTNRP